LRSATSSKPRSRQAESPSLNLLQSPSFSRPWCSCHAFVNPFTKDLNYRVTATSCRGKSATMRGTWVGLQHSQGNLCPGRPEFVNAFKRKDPKFPVETGKKLRKTHVRPDRILRRAVMSLRQLCRRFTESSGFGRLGRTRISPRKTDRGSPGGVSVM